MFVRRKKNRSGSVSVVVVSKERGRFRELQTIGVSANEDEVERLYREGQLWIREHHAIGDMFERHNQIEYEQTAVRYIFNSIENILPGFLMKNSGLITSRRIKRNKKTNL